VYFLRKHLSNYLKYLRFKVKMIPEMKNSVLNSAITSNSTISKKKVSALAGKSY